MKNPSAPDISRDRHRLRHWLSKPITWFVVALVIRLLYLLEQGGTSPLFYQPMLDEREAVDAAQAILNGTQEHIPYFKAPGYSWIMAFIMAVSGGAWAWTIRLVQHTAGAWLVGMIASATGRLTRRRARPVAIIIAGFFAATYGPMIRLEDNLSLDFWSVFFQSAMLFTLMSPRKRFSNRVALFAGCLATASWLVRPTITVALPFIAAWIAWNACAGVRSGRLFRRSLRAVSLFLLPVIIAAAAVTARNFIVSSEALTMPWQGGYSLYFANRDGANGRYFLQSQIVEDSHANPTRHLAVSGYLESLSPPARDQFLNAPQYNDVDKFWFNKTLHEILRDPVRWAGLMTKKIVYLFSDKEIFNYEEFDLQRSLSSILPWMPGRFGIVFPLAFASLAGLGLLSRRRRRFHALLWIYAVTLGGGIALYYVSGRMRMPLAIPMLALSGCGAVWLIQLRGRMKFLAITLLILGAILSWGDWQGVRSESMAHVDLARMSNAAWHRGKYEKAMDYARQAERLAPDYPVIPRLKGQALYNLGYPKKARSEFEKSVRLLGDKSSRHNIEIIDEELKKR